MTQGCTLRWANRLRRGSVLLGIPLFGILLLSCTVNAADAPNSLTQESASVISELSQPDQVKPESALLSATLPKSLSSLPTEIEKLPIPSFSLWQIAPTRSEAPPAVNHAQIMAVPAQTGTVDEQQQFPAWNITQATFSNGLGVLIKQESASQDRVYIQLRARGGMRSLPPELLAAAKLLPLWVSPAPSTSLRQRDPEQSSPLHSFATQNSIKLQPIITTSQHGISGSVENTRIDAWLALARQMLEAPLFSEQILHTIQTQEARAMSQYLQTSKGLFQSHLQQYLFPNNPYVRFSSPRDLQNVSLKQLNAVHAQLRNALAGAELVIVGNVDPQQVLTAVGRYLGGLDLGDKPYWNGYPFLLKKSAPLIDAHNPDEQALVVLTRLSVPAMTDDVEHRLAHKMLQHILQQRMEKQLRTALGITASVTVDMTYPATDMQMNMLQIRAKMQPDQYVDAEIALKKELNTLLIDGCSTQEIEAARQQVKQQIDALWQDPQRSAQTLSVYWLAGYPLDDIMQMPTLLADISEQMLRDLTLHYLNAPGQLTAGFLPDAALPKSALPAGSH
ncbi:MAG: M16 family metallopeptidase [Plesiomonas sp.]|uniref:M16 family metallopeptidase n=2 Tax=Plesiomonas sp. TaxID=2486279 RepID=UPI003F3467C7